MNALDGRILQRLQRDSSPSLNELADAVGLSPSACHRRVKLLEKSGVISGYVARLNRTALGLTIQAFVEISLTSQSEDSLQAFEAAVLRTEEILECHLMTGSADYMLRVAARDVADFERIHRNRLSRLPGVASMQSGFVLRSIREGGAYPVDVA
ncbi:MAG: Lrp/AsnC family transcriptional regulator [Minwuia sp.]|nr:Lrp/AsnC family transcriptional regulator [Minwuia sp.]